MSKHSNELIQFWVTNTKKATENLNEFSLTSLQNLHSKIFFPSDKESLSRYNDLSESDKDQIMENDAGNFRPPSFGRSKPREANKLFPWGYESAYSSMLDEEKLFTEKVLDKNQPKDLEKQPFNNKIKNLANLYEELDYLHPFNDGNSRSIRAFISVLAQKINVNIRWDQINKTDLFIARDLSNLTKVIERSPKTKSYDLNKLKDYQSTLNEMENLKVKNMVSLLSENSKELSLNQAKNFNDKLQTLSAANRSNKIEPKDLKARAQQQTNEKVQVKGKGLDR